MGIGYSSRGRSERGGKDVRIFFSGGYSGKRGPIWFQVTRKVCMPCTGVGVVQSIPEMFLEHLFCAKPHLLSKDFLFLVYIFASCLMTIWFLNCLDSENEVLRQADIPTVIYRTRLSRI